MIYVSYAKFYSLLRVLRKDNLNNDPVSQTALWTFNAKLNRYVITFQDPSHESLFILKYSENL